MKFPQGTAIHSGTYIVDSPLRNSECVEIYIGHNAVSNEKILIHRLHDSLSGYADLLMEKAKAYAAVPETAFNKIIDFFNEGDDSFLITAYCNGETLDRHFSHPVDETTARDFITKLAVTVGNLHLTGHPVLALSPESIHISETGSPVITEFSLPVPQIADSDKSDPYAAPERFGTTGRNSFSHDLYSLGAIHYRLITGQTPPPTGIIKERGLDYPPSVSSQTAGIIDQTLAPQAVNRFASIDEYLTALSVAWASAPKTTAGPTAESETINETAPTLPAEPIPPTPPIPTEPKTCINEPETMAEPDDSAKKSALGRTLIAIGGLVIVGIITGVAYVFWLDSPAADTPAAMAAPVLPDKPENETLTDSLISNGTSKFRYTGPVNASGLPEGTGSADYRNGQWKSYEGEWSEGVWNGNGKLVYANGDIFEGSFDNGSFNEGKYMIQPDSAGKGSYFTGTFKNGTPFNGTWHQPDGKAFQKVTNGETTFL
ncbi:MAG: hypothetical protein K2L46_01290 [Paramuribaculum sp.]|nr:hypothetical protein [Paramuribaculum sp.]